MYVEFQDLPDSSRIWIYQSSQEFSAEQIVKMETALKNFVEEWTRHGDDLKGSFTILHDHFIVLGVDESFKQVSGCSIDASTHIFKGFEEEFKLELFNKLNTAFRNGDHINIVPLQEFNRFAKERKIDETTTVFNNMIQTKRELAEAWEVPAAQSWHRRYFN